ncbi:5-formyltetrahydrofolate cyclo-ligase [Paenisporosarcina cavernae]|uniref:5-formyltetrahydrofolate cyclo-ligase n=1 Tax=Paenisporosarcina cavernae TaxID=2320858 RepID=A0A385YVH9_9BACL|nr:5-formyltetrahydrofolate cyclo-ligase [Paenisporosarcina cavernae]AYC29572.1 5-formyltetrahydrofolate cyclo-ligase [Paenisporosarcina cavernae]
MKKQIRESIIKTLSAMHPESRGDQQEQIESLLIQCVKNQPNWQKVGITISHYPEIETRHIIEKLWELGKKVVVPKCTHKTREMDFYEITSFDQLENVFLYLQEPNPQKTTLASKESIDALIVPGIAFNKEGYRIGFGGGYYDRFLAGFKGDTVSLAFTEQLRMDVPVEKYDLPVDMLITSQQVISCKEERNNENFL